MKDADIAREYFETLSELGIEPYNGVNPGDEVFMRKSMLGEYSFCPYKFKISWWRKGIEGQQVWKSNWLMKIGTRFHDWAEKFWDYCDGFPMNNWEMMIPSQFTEHEREMATWFINLERDRYDDLKEQRRLDEFRPLNLETKLIHKALKLSSTADRFDWHDKSKDEVTVVEYKTGNSWYVPALLSQLAFYAMLWDETVGKGHVTKLKVINPNLKRVETFHLTEKLIDSTIDDIVTLRTAMRNDGPWPRKCTARKFALCKKCKPGDTGLYK